MSDTVPQALMQIQSKVRWRLAALGCVLVAAFVVSSPTPARVHAAGALRQLELQIRTESGAVAVGSSVRWETLDRTASGEAPGLTNAEGKIVFPAIPVGPVALFILKFGEPVVYRPGQASLVGALNFEVNVPPTGPLVLTFPEPRVGHARVAVLTPDGRPVVGARVAVGRAYRFDPSSGFLWPAAAPNRVEWQIQSMPCSNNILLASGCFSNNGGPQTYETYTYITDSTGTVSFPFFLDSAKNTCQQPSYTYEGYCAGNTRLTSLVHDVEIDFTDGVIRQTPGADLVAGVDTVVELPFMPQLSLTSPAVIVTDGASPVDISVTARDGVGSPLTGTNVTAAPVAATAQTRAGAPVQAAAACVAQLSASVDQNGVATVRVCPTSTGSWQIDAPSVLASPAVCIRVGEVARPDFVPVTPARLFDTRPTELAELATLKKKVGPGYELRARVLGIGGIPSCEPVGAVSLNVTVVGPEGAGVVTVYPCGGRPLASNLNYVAGQVVANAVIVPVSAQGEICLFSQSNADLLADINGWFPVSSSFTPVSPTRLFDTRAGEPEGAVGVAKAKVSAAEPLRVKVAGAAGVPGSGVGAVSLNVTVVGPEGAGVVTVYPCGGRPLASNLNYVAGQVVANAVIVPVSAQGEICLFSQSNADLLADINGWFPTG